MKLLPFILVIAPVVVPAVAFAGQVEVVDVRVAPSGAGYRFDVTLRHADEGWEHYADGWEIRGPSGEVLGHRLLAHPHVNEQPFTRSLSGVSIPDGVAEVTIHAHDNVHGWGAAPATVRLPD